jgi:hypothetical protein
VEGRPCGCLREARLVRVILTRERSVCNPPPRNSQVFIENHECLSFIQERGRGLEVALKGLTGEVAGLRGDCKGFEEGAQAIVGGLKRNRQTLQHHLQVSSD